MFKCLQRKPRRIEIATTPDLSDEELKAAFAVSDKHPLWRAIVQLTDQQISANLSDAVDGDVRGTEADFDRGAAAAMLEFKNRLMEVKAWAEKDD